PPPKGLACGVLDAPGGLLHVDASFTSRSAVARRSSSLLARAANGKSTVRPGGNQLCRLLHLVLLSPRPQCCSLLGGRRVAVPPNARVEKAREAVSRHRPRMPEQRDAPPEPHGRRYALDVQHQLRDRPSRRLPAPYDEGDQLEEHRR